MTFALPTGTQLAITKTTPRKEVHGDEHVQAISLTMQWTTANDSLDMLHPQLRHTLFWCPPEVAKQLEIEGLPPVMKHRRCPIVDGALSLKGELTGYTLTIEWGLDESSALELYTCTLKKFRVEPAEGGTVVVTWALSSNKAITPELVGALCALEGETVSATLTPPKPGEEPVIDGSTEAFRRDHPEAGDGPGEPDAGDLFAGQHGGDDDQPPLFDVSEGNDQHAGDFGTGDDDESGSEESAEDLAAFEAEAEATMEAAGLKPARRGGARKPGAIE